LRAEWSPLRPVIPWDVHSKAVRHPVTTDNY